MGILSQNIVVLIASGIWKPENWTGFKAVIYYSYTFVCAFINYSFLLSGIMDFRIKNVDLAVLIDNISLLLCLLTVREKIASVVGKRKIIDEMIEKLQQEPFKPEDDEEQSIYTRYDGYARIIVIFYTYLFAIGVSLYSLGHIWIMEPYTGLPYQGKFPYNYSIPVLYWPTSIYQISVILSAATINLAYDVFLPGLICHVCGQIDILKYRFDNMLKALDISNNMVSIEFERKLLSKWVDHHLDILEFVKCMNETFSSVIFVQYVSSSLILCTVAYVLSHQNLSMSFAGNLFYFIAMMFQIFFQCIAANQITEKFSDLSQELYETNCFKLSQNLQKSMVIILSKTLTPVVFQSGYFVTLTLESFTKVVKASYTVYNVLQ